MLCLMKKKAIIWLLIASGVILICLSVILALYETSNVNIIGGADWSTFRFVFKYRNGGLYSHMLSIGVLGLIAALIVGIVYKKRN